MKKFFIILGIILVVLVASALVLPVIFKEDIKAAIDKELQASVNADILFDVDDFSLSVFTNFPNITATLNNFGVINRAPFAGEILFATEQLSVEINLFSIFGDKPSLTGITLLRPIINIKVLEDGAANYDIAVPSEAEEEVSTTESSEEFSFGIDHWEIIDGDIVYDDATMPFYLSMEEVYHTGSGDFSLDVFDLNIETRTSSVTVSYDGDTYLEGQTAEVAGTITISEDYSRYTFGENVAKVNDFALSFVGWFFMAADYYDMDISYTASNNSFKSLLSIVPGMYSADFADLIAEGNLSLAGDVKGKYDDNQMPSFNLALNVEDAMFQYPDLPTAVENIAVDMKVNNPDGVIENTSIDISRLHLDFGTNPVDAVISVRNLSNYDSKAEIKASLNLAEISQMFPVEGLEMKGLFAMDISAEGTYDSTMSVMPVLAGALSLKDGYIKSSEFPIPLENLRFTSNLSNPSGKMTDFKAVVRDFNMMMDGERFQANLDFSNLVNYTWKATVKGGLDLEKITQIFPQDGMEVKGHILADLSSAGNYASLEAEKYDQLPTSGTMSISDFTFKEASVPYDVTITKASASLTPKRVALDSYTGTIGNSDISMKGEVVNYMGFIFGENELLKGTFNFTSNYLDLNQLMPEYEEDSTSTSEEEAYSAIEVPHNIDFVLDSKITHLHYMDMDIRNVDGTIIVRDGIANLQNLRLNMLGGAIMLTGAYNTNNPDVPKYNMSLNIENISIKESFETFTVVKKLAPVASNIIGNISTDFKISGDLGQDLMPKIETISGSGLLKILNATFGNADILTKLSTVTTLDKSDAVTMKNIAMGASIKDGRLDVKPFDIKLGDYPGSIQGSTGIDGSIDYSIKLNVPASKFGSNLATVSNTLGMGKIDENSTVPLNISMGGSYLRPTFKLNSAGAKEQAKDAITAKAKDEGKKALTDLAGSIKDSSTSQIVSGLLGNKSDTTKADSTKTDLKQEATDKAKEALNKLLKRKKKNN